MSIAASPFTAMLILSKHERSVTIMQVELIPIAEIKPYENNTKLHPPAQIEQIKRSICEYGFLDPIAIDENGLVLEGHGRLIALTELGYKEVPCIRITGLTDEQKRKYNIVHNKTTLNSRFDMRKLKAEFKTFSGFDKAAYGFRFGDKKKSGIAPPMQHNVFENYDKRQFRGTGFYDIPVMRSTKIVSDKLLRFMDWKDIKDHENYIAHFYYDDYKFMAAWREPEKYLNILRKFKAVISPDFSLYTDFPRALQILSCYRRQWCGAYWQSLGIDVIPDVVWGDKKSFAYCFDGIPKHSTVAVSTVGVTRDSDWNGETDNLFRAGYDEMMKRLEPTAVIFYGDMMEGLEGNIIHVPPYYEERRKYLNERLNI